MTVQRTSTGHPPGDFRSLMAAFPTGVSIVTAVSRDGTSRGMTCTSLCSVSLDPPVLLVCLRSASPTLDAVRESSLFAVNLLHSQSRPTAELFASGAPDRFERVAWHSREGAAGPHLTYSSHSIADCSVLSTQVVGDHTVVLGKVDVVTQLRSQQPLLYGMRRYASWPPAQEPELIKNFTRAEGQAKHSPDPEEAQ